MCSPPMLEMSKPSIRTGSDSSPSAVLKRRERVDALRAPALLSQRPGRARARRCARRARAAGASSRAPRPGPRPAPPRRAESASATRPARSRSAGPTIDQPRHRRRRRVVLGEELLGHLGLIGLGLVGEVEAVALGERAVADLEDLGVGLRALDRDRDQVGGLERLAGDRAPLHQRAHRLETVAVAPRRARTPRSPAASAILRSRSRSTSR